MSTLLNEGQIWILDFLNFSKSSKDKWKTVTAISRHIGRSYSSTYAMLKRLVRDGRVEYMSLTKEYAIREQS